jgi:hypothetical protein
MSEGMCYECCVFFETPVFVVNDLHNYKVHQKRDYKKLDHFKEVLNQSQGKEMREIPEDVMQCIREKLPENLEHVSDLTGINITRIILRKSKLSKYSDNANCIWATVSNRQRPYIKKLVEDKLIRYFKAVAQVYEPLKGDKRNSFMNYYYVLYKLLHLMKEQELLNYIPFLRTKHRIREHDKVWRQICLELDWSYYPTEKQLPFQLKNTCLPNFGRM